MDCILVVIVQPHAVHAIQHEHRGARPNTLNHTTLGHAIHVPLHTLVNHIQMIQSHGTIKRHIGTINVVRTPTNETIHTKGISCVQRSMSSEYIFAFTTNRMLTAMIHDYCTVICFCPNVPFECAV